MAAKKTAASTKAKATKKVVAKKPVAKKTAAPKKQAAKKKSSATPASAKKTASKPKAAAPPKARASAASGPIAGIEPYQAGKNEEYMNAEQVEHFRNILLAWKRDLMEEVDRTVHHMQDEAANFPDPNDRATQESEFSMELRARDRERKLIKKIDEALLNLENEEYGYCEACGVEIGIRRLEARPTATLCIDCKTLDEIREKQMG